MSAVDERLSAALADRYRIEHELGAGGMATVFLAEDVKHKRRVAVKVLRPELAAVLGAERFVQEIETTANLQHPHILPLFDSGEVKGFLYYVMPYIEGETLRDKLNRKTQLGIDEAIKITTEVADALDYAHRHNVIHRDIKPENILLHDGRPMVADFGIALAVSAAAGGRMTETGLSLGTPHYMSPEQATAEKALTNRSDIYSLGAVLYEMLTGTPPHVGGSAQQIIMRIVTETPRPVTDLRRSVPANVAAATARSLEKLAADRFDTAAAFAAALTDPTFVASATSTFQPVPVRLRSKERLAWVLLAVVLFVVGGVVWPNGRSSSTVPRAVTRFSINLPDSIPLAFIGSASLGNGRRALTISRDGRTLVYAGQQGNINRLFMRSLDSYEIEALPGTEGAYNPFFSPDGRWVGFFAENTVRKVSVDGQGPVTLTEVPNPMGADWGIDDRIVFGWEAGDLRAVPAEGGVVDILRAGGGRGLYPALLPGNTGMVVSRDDGLWLVSADSSGDRELRPFAGAARYVGSGFLVWSHGTSDPGSWCGVNGRPCTPPCSTSTRRLSLARACQWCPASETRCTGSVSGMCRKLEPSSTQKVLPSPRGSWSGSEVAARPVMPFRSRAFPTEPSSCRPTAPGSQSSSRGRRPMSGSTTCGRGGVSDSPSEEDGTEIPSGRGMGIE